MKKRLVRFLMALSFTCTLLAAIGALVGSAGCGALRNARLCGCLVVWYNAECNVVSKGGVPGPDPLSTGWDGLNIPAGIGVEAAGVVVECPGNGSERDDAGKLKSTASAEMMDRATAVIIKQEGFLTDGSGKLVKTFNQTTGMGSFIKVVSCREVTEAELAEAGPKPSKDWFRYHAKWRPGMKPEPAPPPPPAPGDGSGNTGGDSGTGVSEYNYQGCDDVTVVENDDGTIDVSVYADCPFNPRQEGEEVGGACGAPACEDHSGVNACVDCLQDSCCDGLDACFADLGNAASYSNNCLCRLECHSTPTGGGVNPGCEETCSGNPSPTTTIVAGCAKVKCASVCSAFQGI